MKKFILSIAVAAVGFVSASAASGLGNFFTGIEYEINAGINVGGASPLPLPAEIRQINGYDPRLNLQIGVGASKWLSADGKWGVSIGMRFETKGMKTRASVKNYGMEIFDDGKKLSGRWTGRVHTKYHTQQLAIPITALYRLSNSVVLNAGPYLAYAFQNDFDGHVYDGYLREGDPTGDKYVFEGDSRATYDFGENLRKFQWGMQAGATWQVYNQLSVKGNLTWGCNDIFERSFKTVSFNMYPIYLNLGFSYKF